MNKEIKYSIIYAVLRPEISEQISVGIVTVVNDKVNVRISTQKLKALQNLFTEKEYQFVSRVVKQLTHNNKIDNIETLNYLIRYSNNMITFSPMQSIEIEPTEKSLNRLYQNYVYMGAS